MFRTQYFDTFHVRVTENPLKKKGLRNSPLTSHRGLSVFHTQGEACEQCRYQEQHWRLNRPLFSSGYSKKQNKNNCVFIQHDDIFHMLKDFMYHNILNNNLENILPEHVHVLNGLLVICHHS